ncbi:MAG TPA: hypothetical protein PLL20_10325 [Phycisphaerae bacterium]|nr:hypothetical protein [Phycisphaerae bacterium]HRR84968.1 hypothetical protein [Phycisphaerae bacterium]
MICQERPPKIVLAIWMAVIIIVMAAAWIVIGARSGFMAGLLWAAVIWVMLGGVEVTYFILHHRSRDTAPPPT